MGQNKVFTTFRAPVNSFPLGEMNLGLMKPGRYSGFDNLVEVLGLEISIRHTSKIQKASASVDDTIDLVSFGSLLTPNGSVIHNEAITGSLGIDFDISNNLGNTNTRYDLVVCEHEYISIVGGQDPIYFIVEGDLDGNVPELSNPEKQVLIGIIKVAPGGYQFSDLTYKPALVPLLGAITPEELVSYFYELVYPGYCTTTQPGLIQLADPDEVTGRGNNNKALTPASVILMLASETLLGLSRQATDVEILNNTVPGGGVKIFVSPQHLRSYGRIRDFINHTTGDVTIPASWNGQTICLNGDAGATPVVDFTIPEDLPTNFSCKIITSKQNVQFLTTGSDTEIFLPAGKQAKSSSTGVSIILERVSITLPKFTLDGSLKDVVPSGSTGLVPMLAAVPYFPVDNDLSMFNGTGLGLSGDVIGWAICNGQNGTRDLRHLFLVQYDPANSLYNEVGKTGGSPNAIVAKHTHLTVSDVGDQDTLVGSNKAILRTANFGSDSNYRLGSGNLDAIIGGRTSETGEEPENKNLPPFYTCLYIQRIN